MTYSSIGTRVLVGVVTVFLAPPLRARPVVFDNMPNGQYYYQQGVSLTYAPSFFHEAGYSFVASGGGALESFDVVVSLVAGNPELDLRLMSDQGGYPGIVLESVHVSGGMGQFGQTVLPIVHATAAGVATLVAGERYWVIGRASELGSTLAWHTNATGDQGIMAWRYQHTGPWNVSPDPVDRAALRVRTSSVCYPDCNADGQLTVADFGCFQTRFVSGNPYADCTGDSQLNVLDFGCFQTKFVLGCP